MRHVSFEEEEDRWSREQCVIHIVPTGLPRTIRHNQGCMFSPERAKKIVIARKKMPKKVEQQDVDREELTLGAGSFRRAESV